jgi:hypothetical protein
LLFCWYLAGYCMGFVGGLLIKVGTDVLA